MDLERMCNRLRYATHPDDKASILEDICTLEFEIEKLEAAP